MVYGSFFFAEATITRPVYLDMPEQFLETRILTVGIVTVIFQQDGVPCHYVIIVLDYLDRHFPGRWIIRGGTQTWAGRSPDLTLLVFFAWGLIESKMYPGRRIGDLA
jgi:hypothetical protein